MKKILFALTMIFALVFASEAWAVFGINDPTPANDINTLLIADDEGMDVVGYVSNVDTASHKVKFGIYRTQNPTAFIKEWEEELPPKGGISVSFRAFLDGITPLEREDLKITVAGRKFYAAVLSADIADKGDYPNTTLIGVNVLLGWFYLVDLQKGFSAGFNAVAFEGFRDYPFLEYEHASHQESTGKRHAFTASALYFRYFVMNDNAETYNLLFLLMGMDGLSFTGEACNEQGICAPIAVPTGNRVTILDVEEILPPQLKGDYPWAGYIEIRPDDPSQSYIGGSYQRVGWSAAGGYGNWSVWQDASRRY